MDAIETSKTHRLYLLLKEQITSGALSSGHRLPGETTLAESHGMSRVTVRRALDGLTREGLVRRQVGAGTFVSSKAPESTITGDLTNMLMTLAAMGRNTRVRLLAFDYGQPPAHIGKAMRLPEDGRTQMAIRVRYLNDEPFSYLTTHVPEHIGQRYSRDDLASTPLLTLLEQNGVGVEKAEQSISATLAGPETAAALQVEIGSPLIALTRTVFDASGLGVEHLSALYRPDKHRFHMEMTRTGHDDDRHWQPVKPVSRDTSGRREAASRRRRP
ncbi:MAG: GntR family transcriptional regulator [Beijerinckiaceae bacterium]